MKNKKSKKTNHRVRFTISDKLGRMFRRMLKELEINIIIERNGVRDSQNIYKIKSIDFGNNTIQYYNGDEIETIEVNSLVAIDIKSTIPTIIISKKGEF